MLFYKCSFTNDHSQIFYTKGSLTKCLVTNVFFLQNFTHKMFLHKMFLHKMFLHKIIMNKMIAYKIFLLKSQNIHLQMFLQKLFYKISLWIWFSSMLTSLWILLLYLYVNLSLNILHSWCIDPYHLFIFKQSIISFINLET